MKFQYFLISIFLLTTSINVKCQWTYYPFQKDSNGLLNGVHQIESDKNSDIYCRARVGGEIDIYHPTIDKWERVKINIPVSMTFDKDNNLWITSAVDGLIKYDGNDTINYSHLLMKYFSGWESWNKPLMARITCDEKNNVWFGDGEYLFKLKNNDLKSYNFEEFGISKLLYEDEIYFYGDKLVFTGNNGLSLIIFDPENPTNFREIQLSDTTGKDKKPSIEDIVINNNEIYCKVRYNWEYSPTRFISLYKLNDNKFDSVSFDYVQKYNSYSIQDFCFDKNGNALVFVSVWDGKNRYGELVTYNNWKYVNVYRTPEVDNPIQPIKSRFKFIADLRIIGDDVWMCDSELGVLRLNLNPDNIKSEEKELSSPKFQIVPNPAGDYITIKLGAINPTLKRGVDETSIQIYNTLGEKVLSKPILPMYVSHRMNIERLPKGIYFVKVGGETAKFVKM